MANLYPADAVLNLPLGKHSHGLRRLAASEAARGSFEQAADALERVSGVRVGKRQLEALAGAAAADVAGFYAQQEPPARPDAGLLVLSFDGEGIVMRPPGAARDHRQGGANHRPQAGHPPVSRGETRPQTHGRARRRLRRHARPPRPGDVISRPGRPRTGKPGPQARGKWLSASITNDIPTVIATAFDQAHRRDPGHRRPWIALVDAQHHTHRHQPSLVPPRRLAATIACDLLY